MGKLHKTKQKQTVENLADAKHEEIKDGCGFPQWNPHLSFYKDQRVLTFQSEKHLDAAIGLLWTDPLRTLPHDTAGRRTLIIPAEAVQYFSRAGLRFTEKRLRSAAELTPDERKKLRR